MKQSPEILNEITAICPALARIGNSNVFRVPEGYFNTLNLKVSDRILTNTREVPENYFETLSDKILSKVKLSDTDELPAVLKGLQHLNVFGVPENYFGQFANRVNDKVKPAKVIVMNSISVWRYAVAAVLTGIIGISSLWTLNNNNTTTNKENYTLAENLPSYIKQSFQYKTESSVTEGIDNLSDEEILGYLQNTGSATDNETLIKTIDANKLPDQKDYLLDEQTLETYLNNLDAKAN